MRSPWGSISITIDKDILERGKHLFGFRITMISKLIINIVLKLIFIFNDLLNLITIIDGIFEYFFKLGIIGIETNSSLM